MSLFYRAGVGAARIVFWICIRRHVLNPRATDRAGGFVLAVTHLSHLEPFCASVMNRRKIDWMTRKEFYRYRPFAWGLHLVDAFKVNRQGIPVSAVRTAINRVRAGRVVGIFPEGGVKVGPEAAFRGGAIKRGCASVALHTGAPIVPCVMLGTNKLNAVLPWIPWRRATIHVAYGEPIHPPAAAQSTRATRRELADQVARAFQDLYAKLRAEYAIDDAHVP
jgi:1-acyl-sn-glycerol-3-phosphate acyltransferase